MYLHLLRRSLGSLIIFLCFTGHVNAQTWNAGPTLNEGRAVSAVTIDSCNRIIATGGRASWCPQTETASCEIFDPDTGTWSLIAPMNEPRVNHAAVCIGEFVYVLGGQNPSETSLASVDRYDMVSDTWDDAVIPSMNFARSALTAVTDGHGRIYAIGGRTTISTSDHLVTVEMFDVQRPGLGWVVMPNTMNEARVFHATAIDQLGRLYAIGGKSGAFATLTVERFDPCQPGSGWLYVSSLPVVMSGAGASAVTGPDGSLYVVGSDVDQPVQVRRYLPDSDLWLSWIPMGVDLYETNLVITREGAIWAIGGVDPDPGVCPKLASSNTLVIGTTSCPSDIDSTGEVNVTDLLLLLAAWGACP